MSGILVVAGVSFKKTDVTVRGRFAFTPDQCISHYHAGREPLFILSTCNRTEIYGVVPDPEKLIDLLCQHAGVDQTSAHELIYSRTGYDAAIHLFRVASGLDSQIPGDYEIVSQLKTAFRLARENGISNGYLEKVFNFALQASKEVKRNTGFSNGTLSIPYTVARSICAQPSRQAVTIMGAGATARLVLNAIKRFAPQRQVNVVNRTFPKVQSLLDEHTAVAAYHEHELDAALRESDTLVITTNSVTPLVHSAHLMGTNVKSVYDLSVPRNAAPDVYSMHDVTTVDVDQLSAVVNAELNRREREAAHAETVVLRVLHEFRGWAERRELYANHKQSTRKHVPKIVDPRITDIPFNP